MTSLLATTATAVAAIAIAAGCLLATAIGRGMR